MEIYSKTDLDIAIETLKIENNYPSVRDSSFTGILEMLSRKMPGETSLIPLGEVVYDSIAHEIYFLRR